MKWSDIVTDPNALYRAARTVYRNPYHAKIAFIFSMSMIGLPFFFYYSDQGVNAQEQCEKNQSCPLDFTMSGLSLLIPIPMIGLAWWRTRGRSALMLKKMRRDLRRDLGIE